MSSREFTSAATGLFMNVRKSLALIEGMIKARDEDTEDLQRGVCV
jgi:hypothetical protein